MGDLNIIDQFTQTFGQYIDSGFGLLGSDVGFLTTILVGIDITLAGLWWAMDGDGDLLGRLIKKILYVGIFALILNNFQNFANIVYQSFSGLGLHASANSLTADDLLRPGKLAGTGFTAAKPLLDQASTMLGFPQIFGNFITVCILLVSWFFVIVAFFVLAVQLFITIIEFKLTTLAGFTLVPFALWNKTSFLAERVLGSVISSGIKVMVLAVIVGIGSSFFGQFTTALQGQQPDVGQAMSLVLASLSLVGLGIFGPGIAAGLVSGAPQLGAGAAIGTVGAGIGAAALAGGAAVGGVRALGAASRGGMAAIRAGTAMGSAAATAYQAGAGGSGTGGVGAGLGGMARAAGGAASQGFRAAAGRMTSSLGESARQGREAAMRAMGAAPQAGPGAPPPNPGTPPPSGGPSPSGGTPPSGTPGPTGSGPSSAPQPSPPSGGNSAPPWARRLRSEQQMRGHADATARAIKEGDRPGSGANPDLSTEEE